MSQPAVMEPTAIYSVTDAPEVIEAVVAAEVEAAPAVIMPLSAANHEALTATVTAPWPTTWQLARPAAPQFMYSPYKRAGNCRLFFYSAISRSVRGVG